MKYNLTLALRVFILSLYLFIYLFIHLYVYQSELVNVNLRGEVNHLEVLQFLFINCFIILIHISSLMYVRALQPQHHHMVQHQQQQYEQAQIAQKYHLAMPRNSSVENFW